MRKSTFEWKILPKAAHGSDKEVICNNLGYILCIDVRS